MHPDSRHCIEALSTVLPEEDMSARSLPSHGQLESIERSQD